MTDLVTCHACGSAQVGDARFCTMCGASFKELTCSNCGSSLPDDAFYCQNCMTPVDAPPVTRPSPDLPPAPVTAGPPPPDESYHAYAIAAAALGVILLLGIVWFVTNSRSGGGETLSSTTTIGATVPTTAPIVEDAPTTTGAVASTVAAPEEVSEYRTNVSTVLASIESAVADMVFIHDEWDANEAVLAPAARSDLYSDTEDAFGAIVDTLDDLDNQLAALAPPADGLTTHADMVESAQLLADHAGAVLAGLQLPRGSEEVDGTARRDAMTDLETEMNRFRGIAKSITG